MMTDVLTGGCQCGAVRFRVDGAVQHGSVCHCRMCQKATGGLFGAFGTVRAAELTWTRGAPGQFRSSTVAVRGFCTDCGTPLTYTDGGRYVAIAVGAFDRPEAVAFDFALEVENRLPVVATLMDLPARPMASTPEEEAAYDAMRNFQHPDHDTEAWPLPGESR